MQEPVSYTHLDVYKRQMYGGWFWSLEEVWDDWDHVYSDPYFVELPEGFSIGESVSSSLMIFREGCNIGYEVYAGSNTEHCLPHLIGGNPVENITLKVIGPVKDQIGGTNGRDHHTSS